MSATPPYSPHYTLADYQQWEGDWELWNGVAVAMTPSPFGRHQWVAGQWLTKLNTRLAATGCRDCYALGETDWVIAKDMVVRPDIAVVCGSFPERFIDTVPTLVIEVLSASTASKDRTAKFELYRQQGVRYYFLIEPETEAVEAYELSGGQYRTIPATSPYHLMLHDRCEITLA